MSLLSELWGSMWSTRHARLRRRKERQRRAIRGHGNWTQQQNRVVREQRAKVRAVRGTGNWTQQQNRAARYRRQVVRKQARRFFRRAGS